MDLLRNIRQLRLEQLSLDKCNLGDQIIQFVEYLSMETLAILLIPNNGITDDGAIAIANMLAKSNLIHLDLFQNKISVVGLKYIVKQLPNCKLQKLNIYENCIENDGYTILFEGLGHSKIKELHAVVMTLVISEALNNSLGNLTKLELEIKCEYLESLLDAVTKSKLQILSFYGQLDGFEDVSPAFDDQCARILVKYVERLPIRELNLYDCVISKEISEQVFQSITHKSNVRSLKITYNTLPDISSYLWKSPLKSLTLWGCELTDEFLYNMIEPVKISCLERLDLLWNEFTTLGKEQFITAIQCSKLKEIKL
ncbi:hypothetical protein HDV01_003202 [Terramyces sp. JEL0728]|nr:hypothetical protein HDV01_003202 [Terramyces sp. JEL0728]